MMAETEWLDYEEPAIDIEAEVLRLYPTHSMTEISQLIGISDQIISNTAHRLERQGLLKIRTPAENRLMQLGRPIPKPTRRKPLSMTKAAIKTRAYRARVRARGDHQ